MYFPYLYARQSELLALRAVRNAYPVSQCVVPIFESVNRRAAPLIKALNEYGEAQDSLIVITNPVQHEFRGGVPNEWDGLVSATIEAHASIIPGLLCTPTTARADVATFLKSYRDRDVALLYMNATLSDADMQKLAERGNVRFHIVLQERMSAAHRALLPLDKVVDVRDDFKAKARNADYEGVEFFTDRHLTFSQVAVGFGDYAVVGATFSPGGGPPSAVAIHGTYKAKNGHVWVEHFVSDDVEQSVGTVGEKFLQAATKLKAKAQAEPKSLGNDAALQQYAADVSSEHFPGLGKNKERQIYHHVALMHQLLNGAL